MMSRSSSTPAMAGNMRPRGQSDWSGLRSHVDRSGVFSPTTRTDRSFTSSRSLHTGQAEEADMVPHINGHGHDTSFVLSAHGGNSPSPWDSPDYRAMRRGLRGKESKK